MTPKRICDYCGRELSENDTLREYFGSKICGRCYRSQHVTYRYIEW